MIGLGLGLSQHRAMSGGVADPYVPPTEDPYTPPADPPDEPTVTPDPELTDLTRIDIVDSSTVVRTTNDPGTFGVSYISATLIGPEYWEFEVMNGTPTGATFAVGITTLAMPLNGIPGDRATEIAWWSDGKIKQGGATIVDLGAAGAMAKGDTGGIGIDASGNVFLWKNCAALNSGSAVGVLAPGADIYPFVALYSERTKIGFNFTELTFNCALPSGFYEIGGVPVFTPASLFASGEDGFYIEVQDAESYADTGGTTPATIGVQAVRVDDPVNGYVFLEGAPAAPVYSLLPKNGRRNTVSARMPSWQKVFAGTGVSPTITDDYEDGPFGAGFGRAVRLQLNKGTGTTSANYAGIQHAASGKTISIWAKVATGTATLAIRALGGTGTYTVVTLTTEWQRLTYTPGYTSSDIQLILRGTYGTGNTIDCTLWAPMMEAGVTATNSQEFVSTYEIYEPQGKTLYGFDGASILDDQLNTTLPSLGSACTRWLLDDTGLTITTGVTVGAGSYNMMAGFNQTVFASGLIDRELTAQEQSDLTAYLEAISSVSA